MRKHIFIILVLIPLAGNSQSLQKKFNYAEELENFLHVDRLPLYRDHCVVEQVSSYDPTGGNDDGFEGTYSFVRKEKGQWILADLKGPGVINRIWTPTPTKDTLEFYFDGEKKPRIKICFNELFTGEIYPFVYPLCGNEIGGYYCYLPIPYRKSCKIVFTGERMRFYQIQYRNLPEYKVESFTGNLSQEEKNVLCNIRSHWQKGQNPLPKPYTVNEETFILEPGSEQVFFSRKSGGRIIGIEIDDNSYVEGLYKDILLQACWDNDTLPAIHVPAADFFGYSFGKPAMRSLLIGKKGESNYCYLPCPYDSGAEMKLIYKKRENIAQPAVLIKTSVYYTETPREPSKEGKLYAHWRREINPPAGNFYDFLSVKGKGHYVGTIHQTQGLLPEMTAFFEGDDSTYIDGKMRIHGTGSEDYYNGGWYALPDRWDIGLSLPLHGSLEYSLPFSRTGGYRFYLTDKLTFEQELYQGIEHGPVGNEYPVDYTSVAFYYADKPLFPGMTPKEHLREVYIPSEFRFYPQLMKYTLYQGTQVEYGRGIRISSAHEGAIKLFLDDIPEGKYKIYLSYFTTPQQTYFSVWHRQKRLQDWRSATSPQEEFKHKQYIGDTYFTPQTNSLTIKIKHDNMEAFEFDCLYLERIEE